MPNSKLGGHYSHAFDEELKQAVERLSAMAALVQQQLRDSMQAFTHADLVLAKQVKKGDRQVNNFEVDIDEHCLAIIARRQPAASDLRLVLAVLKCINDVERIGDQAKRIVKTLLKDEQKQRPNEQQLAELVSMSEKVMLMFEHAISAFEKRDVQEALKVLREDKAIDDDYAVIMQQSLALMMDDPRLISVSLQISNVAKALERVGDHSRNICQHTVFLIKGINVAHLKDDELIKLFESTN